MDHRIWLDQLIDGDSYRNAAAKIGINQSTITKQLGKEKLSAENVIALARAYGRRAGDELVVTGYLTDEDIEGVGVERALHSATNHQLLNEIDRRMADGIGDVQRAGRHRPRSAHKPRRHPRHHTDEGCRVPPRQGDVPGNAR